VLQAYGLMEYEEFFDNVTKKLCRGDSKGFEF
jgi:hypothetical protein